MYLHRKPAYSAFSNTITRYQYTALGDEEIRVLRLLPGDPSALQLGLEILSRQLRDATSSTLNAPQLELLDFDALSYCWNPKRNIGGGSTNANQLRVINPGTVLPVTALLYLFLSRIRLPDADRLLWADVVCINQRDEKEKAHQIELMPRIYSTARAVIVDLGEDEDGTGSEAIDLLESYWRKYIWSGSVVGTRDQTLTSEQIAMYVGLESHELPPMLGPPEEITNLPPNDNPSWKSVARLFSRSWFTCIWVIQEFVLARQAIMMYGT